MHSGITYITVVNEFYLPLLDKLIETHQKFSNINLHVFTVNFEVTDREYKNIKFIKCTESNLLNYEKGESSVIKNDFEKHKYTTILKPKLLKNFINNIKYYFFIDCDVIFTKNSDELFLNAIKEYGYTDTPISTKFFHQFCNHGNNENIFNEDGGVNLNSLTYKPICDLYGEEPKVIDYVSTYCMYYTDKCYDFFNEVDKICTDIFESGLDCKLYLPLGDETVFNYIYSRDNFTKYLSSFSCYNLSPHTSIKTAVNNIKKLNNVTSFIHTKRLLEGFKYSGDLGLDDKEYDYIIDILGSEGHFLSLSKVLSYHKDYNNNSEVLVFNTNEDHKNSEVKFISLLAQKEDYHQMSLEKGVDYFIGKSIDLINKEIYIVIYREDEVRDVFKVV